MSHLMIFHFSVLIFGSTINPPVVWVQVDGTLSLVRERWVPPRQQHPQLRPPSLLGDGGRD